MPNGRSRTHIHPCGTSRTGLRSPVPGRHIAGKWAAEWERGLTSSRGMRPRSGARVREIHRRRTRLEREGSGLNRSRRVFGKTQRARSVYIPDAISRMAQIYFEYGKL